MTALIESIQTNGLEEPLIVSSDHYIISGHRRYYACKEIGFDEVPVRLKDFTRTDRLDDWSKILAEYNPQRIKGPASLLRESLMRFTGENTRHLIKDYNTASAEVDVNLMRFTRSKNVNPIGRRQEFLEAVIALIEGPLKPFLPTTLRTIHYNLLNDPPLTQTCKTSTKSRHHYRYKNDKKSYKKLSRLVTDARYLGLIDIDVIDDRVLSVGVQNRFFAG
jgi:hypothetical protein